MGSPLIWGAYSGFHSGPNILIQAVWNSETTRLAQRNRRQWLVYFAAEQSLELFGGFT